MHKNDECLREILKENKIVFTEECEDEISASRFYATIYDAKCTIYNVANMTWMVGEVKLGKNKDKSVLYKELNELNCSNPFFIFYYDCEKEVLVTQLQIFYIENRTFRTHAFMTFFRVGYTTEACSDTTSHCIF